MRRPSRYYVEVMEPCPHVAIDCATGTIHECCPHLRDICETDSLPAAKMARARVIRRGLNASVHERENIRDLGSDAGVPIWEWDHEPVIVDFA